MFQSISISNQDECAFFTRHDGRCIFTSVDFRVTTLLGHLPQEMRGASIFKFLHHDDLPLIVEIHKKILGEWVMLDGGFGLGSFVASVFPGQF